MGFFTRWKSGSGGTDNTSTPSNVVLFESWVEGETVTIDTSVDTTAPILTITSGGTFSGNKTVTMSVNEIADIYYTTNGTTPTISSTKYTNPLSISATTTVKAFARDTSGNQSSIQTITYTLDTTTPSDTISPENVTNLTTSNITSSSLTLSWNASVSSDIASYDIYRGTTLIGNVIGTSYNVSGLTASTSYTFKVVSKDSSGNVSSGATVNVSTTAQVDTTAPVLTITPSTIFTDTQTVTMSTNETATIWYTLDDSDPITSGTRIQYTVPLTLTATDTIKAYTVDIANNASAVQTVTYTKQTNSSFVSDGLVMHLNGAGSTGTTWTDATGNGNSGTLVNYDNTSASGWNNNALISDGTNDYVTILHNTNLKTESQSIEFVISLANTTSFHSLYNNRDGTGTGNGLYLIADIGGKLGVWFTSNTGNFVSNTALLTANTKTHVVMTRTASQIKMYVNGILKHTQNVTALALGDRTTNLFRRGDNALYSANTCYLIRQYNKALSDVEVTQNYNASMA